MTKLTGAGLAAVSLAALISAAAAQAQAQRQGSQGPAAAESPENGGTMPRADKDMRRVLAKLQELGAKPLGSQGVEETRKGPTPADAVKAILKEEGKDPDKLMAEMGVSKRDIRYSGPSGEMPARVYAPEGGGEGGKPRPIIVYFHGGGWVIADLDTYEASAMALARKANAVVVSVEYRHAPEAKFPAAHEDAIAAYSWILRNAQAVNGDPQRVALAGESAGGNLALNVAISARQGGFQKPAHLLLVYPVAGTDTNTPSYQKNADAMPLGKAGMEWFVRTATNGTSDLQDPKLDIVGKADLKDLPDTTIITAEIDPLMSEGRALADKMKKAGVEVKYQNFDGVTHEFFGMAPVVKDAERAQDLAARELKDAFAEQAKATGGTRGRGEGQKR